jgi:sortase (surface protein transpeptidase)
MMRHFGNRSAESTTREAAGHASPSRQSRARHPRARALSLLCTLLAVGGSSAIAYALVTAPTPPPQPTAAQAGTLHQNGARHLHTNTARAAMPASPPTRVRIPSIDVNAVVDVLGLNTDGTVEVPSLPDDAGWYSGSATPGQIGAAVLLGHVDFVNTGPAVFYRLGELKPGAAISVARKDGSTAAFTVDAVREFPKSDFPTDEVYGPTGGTAQLRLITCGSWDADQHKYVGNTVVFATLTPPKATGSASPNAHTGGVRGPR